MPITAFADSADEPTELERRLIIQLRKLRQDGADSVTIFVESCEADLGGALKVEAPCRQRKRTIPEAAFRTERWNEIA